MRSTVAGIDIGGTKTRIVLAHAHDGTVIEDRTLPSTGWQTRSLPEAAAWIVAKLTSVPARIAVGAHASETPEQCESLADELRALLSVPVTVVNDAELLVPAAGFEHGVGVVAGTGSIAVGRHRETGAHLTAGGWGWVLGDEGSGSALVREAARAVLGRADEGASPDPLEKALLTAFGVPALPELAAVMSWDGGVETWARHAPVVFAAADEGSALAADVIEEGGRQLAILVGRLVARGARTDAVVVAGGVITAQQRLFDAFARALADGLPGTVPVLLDAPPVRGALALALALRE
ncbi:N-acetylglucosamine kinase [Streptomyces beijiangensis]|uniref:ATPase n=1 Tax=Streptomyces beijiangensis TaxID=163361 RepID=A0A939F9E6_9ACTN|nr:BadF/BadG/BcrA/BcrD ATPase family protein [Streptomyces beijiangensis]MBO0514029.1 ATPase [Streptomyces beijiangensis]